MLRMDVKGIFLTMILSVAVGGATTACADVLDVTLAPSGDVRFGEKNDCTFRMLASLPGWKGLSAKGGWEIKKPGVAPFTLAYGGYVFMDAVATHEQLPEGKARVSYSFTPVEDVELVSLGCTLSQPSGPVAGKPWKTPSHSGVFARPANDGIQVMGEKGQEISVSLGGDGCMLTFRSDDEVGIAIQDNWRWGESYSRRLGTLAQKKWKKLHALRSGEWDFNLPFHCRVVNLASGRDEQQDGDRLRLALTAGETCWLRLYAKGAE